MLREELADRGNPASVRVAPPGVLEADVVIGVRGGMRSWEPKGWSVRVEDVRAESCPAQSVDCEDTL